MTTRRSTPGKVKRDANLRHRTLRARRPTQGVTLRFSAETETMRRFEHAPNTHGLTSTALPGPFCFR